MSSRHFLRVQETLLIVSLFSFSSCVWLPFATSSYIDKKLQKIPIGSSAKEIYAELGQPYFRITFSAADGPVEVYGYELGNYWYHEPCLLVIRGDRLVGVSKDAYALLQMLTSLKAFPAAQFWKSGETENAFPRRVS